MAEDKTEIIFPDAPTSFEHNADGLSVQERYLARFLSAAVLSSTLVSPAIHFGEEMLQTRTVAEQNTQNFVPHDNHGKPVSIGPGMTISLPTVERTGPNNYSIPVAPQQITERVADRYCKTPNIGIPNYLNYDTITRGGHTEFALSYDKAEAIKTRLASARSIEDVQVVAKDMFATLDIRTSFGDLSFDNREEPEPYATAHNTENVLVYAHQIAMLANMLELIPREMTAYVDRVDLLPQEVIGFKNNMLPLAGGLYREDEIQLPIYSTEADRAMVHEFAHSIHDHACSNPEKYYDDDEFESAYNQAIALLQPGPLRQAYQEADAVQPNKYEQDQKDEQNAFAGFPTEYSKKNYKELFAELTTSLIVDGKFVDGDRALPDTENTRKLQALVIERLQKELPHTDVAAYLEFTNYYANQLKYPARPLRDFVDNRVSTFDRNFSMYGDAEQGQTYTLSPAIAVKPGHGMPEQYIYATYDVRSKDDSYAQIIANSSDPSIRAFILQAGSAYMRSLQQKYPTLDDCKLVVNESGDSAYITLEPLNPKGGSFK